MPARREIVGLRFGRLVVSGDGPYLSSGRRTVICNCDCGNSITIEPRDLTRASGATRSCGCLQREAVARSSAQHSVTHGMSHSPEHNTWRKLRSRCNNPDDRKYALYGGRGVKVCERWDMSFEAFYADMGPKPRPEMSIDRIDVNGDYEPGNCRWATPLEQARNKQHHRMVIFNGSSMPLSQACELSGVNYRSALYRMSRGGGWRPAHN